MSEPKASRPHMPGYGILDADKGKGLLPWSWAAERLSKARNYWVATARPNGNPHARNLIANPRCVIGCEIGDDQIVLEGEARLITDSGLRRRFGDAYQAKYNWDMEGSSEPFYRVRPVTVFGFSTAPGEFVATATRWTFDER
jgi:hypothetical protein